VSSKWSIGRLASVAQRPALAIGVDTAAVSACNALMLLLGARALPASELTPLAMFQLILVTVVGLQRATLLSPALAAQRSIGEEGEVPTRWAVVISLPTALTLAWIVPLLLGASDSYLTLVALSATGLAALLVQDLLRFVHIARGTAHWAALSDIVWVAAFLLLVTLVPLADAWTSFAVTWVASAWLAVIILLVSSAPWRRQHRPPISLGGTLRLGRWSGMDNALSASANLIPMVVTSLAVVSPLAGVYRLVQTALGPLNIVNTTLVAVIGRGAWKLTNLRELGRLKRQAIRIAAYLSLATLVYLALAFPLVIIFTGVSSPDLPRIVAIYAFSALCGAIASPFSSSALALGYQFVGLLIRVIVFAFAIAVSILVVQGVWIPWNDPIGLTAIVSSALGLVGWLVGFALANRRERRLLSSRPEPSAES
jgi:O-antigen/teichoic acid export membrane protein